MSDRTNQRYNLLLQLDIIVYWVDIISNTNLVDINVREYKK